MRTPNHALVEKYEKWGYRTRDQFKRLCVVYWFQRLKSSAAERNIPFDLSIMDLDIPDKCPILDIPLFFSNGKESGQAGPNTPSVDRIDNTRGYTKDNIRVISYKANVIKGSLSLDIVERLHHYSLQQA